jgi:hypothetical protein
MAKKTRKTVKEPEIVVPDETEEELEEEEMEDELEEEEMEEVEVSSPVASSVDRSSSGRRQRFVASAPQKKYFTALLMEGTTYEYLGMVFRKGVPSLVPMKYLQRFRCNGWFQVSGV